MNSYFTEGALETLAQKIPATLEVLRLDVIVGLDGKKVPPEPSTRLHLVGQTWVTLMCAYEIKFYTVGIGVAEVSLSQ